MATPAPLALRPDRSIFSARGGWYRARWHFSFDQYADRSNMGIGHLRVLNHDTLIPGAVWPMHPHRDIEGITFVVAFCSWQLFERHFLALKRFVPLKVTTGTSARPSAPADQPQSEQR